MIEETIHDIIYRWKLIVRREREREGEREREATRGGRKCRRLKEGGIGEVKEGLKKTGVGSQR